MFHVCVVDNFHSAVKGASMSVLSFRRRVESGSVVRRILRMTAVTSSTVKTRNVEKLQPGGETKHGGGASAVDHEGVD